MFKTKSIAFKLILTTLTATTLIFAVIFLYNYRTSRQLIQRHAEENAQNIAQSAASRIETALVGVEKIAETTARFVESNASDRPRLEQALRDAIQSNPQVYGAGVSFEPFAFDPSAKLFAPYFHRQEAAPDGLGFMFLQDAYDYQTQDWYAKPKALGRPMWSEPYFDSGAGNAIMCTYSVPIFRNVAGKRTFVAMLTADVTLAWLERIVGAIRVFENGYGFLLSREGRFITHPTAALVMKKTIFDVATEHSNPRLTDLGTRMTHGDLGFVPHTSLVTHKPGFVYFMPLTNPGWSIGVVCPEDELLADVRRLNRIMFALGFTGFAILFGVIVLIAGSITRPLRMLASAASTIARGNLEGSVPPITSRDEVGELAAIFGQMVVSLRQHIRGLTEATAARERIESELMIARNIQMDMLPGPLATRTEVDLEAVLLPAREVGGDLYDHFWLDDHRLAFTIGDVSGKGVAAALFMAMTKTLHKFLVLRSGDPSAAVAALNGELSAENRAAMFVTLFSAVLDVHTGELRFCNAGHNPPLLLRRRGTVEPLDHVHGPAVGVFGEVPYGETNCIKFEPGDALVLYTDGVTEALNEQDAFYGDDRLRVLAGHLAGSSPGKIVSELRKDLAIFTGSAPQSDDITLLVVRLCPLPKAEALL